jgi:hypothetical protein
LGGSGDLVSRCLLEYAPDSNLGTPLRFIKSITEVEAYENATTESRMVAERRKYDRMCSLCRLYPSLPKVSNSVPLSLPSILKRPSGKVSETKRADESGSCSLRSPAETLRNLEVSPTGSLVKGCSTSTVAKALDVQIRKSKEESKTTAHVPQMNPFEHYSDFQDP